MKPKVKVRKDADTIQQKPVTQRNEEKSLIQRVIHIIISDIKRKFTGFADEEERMRFADYERFCEIARGKK